MKPISTLIVPLSTLLLVACSFNYSELDELVFEAFECPSLNTNLGDIHVCATRYSREDTRLNIQFKVVSNSNFERRISSWSMEGKIESLLTRPICDSVASVIGIDADSLFGKTSGVIQRILLSKTMSEKSKFDYASGVGFEIFFKTNSNSKVLKRWPNDLGHIYPHLCEIQLVQ